MDSLPVINKSYEVYKGIITLNDKLEKRKKYSLGTGIENSLMSCMENLIMAKNAPKPMKASYLILAGSKLEITILKLRLYLELKLANETKIFQLQAQCAEVGRMIGGWMKACQNQSK